MCSSLALFVLGLASAGDYPRGAAARPSDPLPEPNISYLHNNASIISDFDGDNQPDLATSRSEGYRLKVEIQLSSRAEVASFTLPGGQVGVGLLVCDIDQDNDFDIIILSPASLQPLAVWLNDGQGHFARDQRGSPDNPLKRDGRPIYGYNNDRLHQVPANQNERSPLDQTILGPVWARFDTGDPISGEWREPPLQSLTYKLAARSPPHHGTL